MPQRGGNVPSHSSGGREPEIRITGRKLVELRCSGGSREKCFPLLYLLGVPHRSPVCLHLFAPPPMGSDIPLLPSSTNAEPFLSPTPQLGICGWNQLAHVSFSSGNPCLQGSMKIAGERALPEAPSFRPAPTVTKTFHFPGQGSVTENGSLY